MSEQRSIEIEGETFIIDTVDNVGPANARLNDRYDRVDVGALRDAINAIEKETGKDYVIMRGPGLAAQGVIPVEEDPEPTLTAGLPNAAAKGDKGIA